MDYVPNHLARGLCGKPTQTVGILWSLCGPHYSEGVTRRITLLAQKRGYCASVADSLSDRDVMLHALADFARRRVDAVIMQVGNPALLDDVVTRALEPFKAVVLVSRDPVETTRDLVLQTSGDAIGQAVVHVVRLARKRLAFMGHLHSSLGKLCDLRHAMAENGLDPADLIEIDFSYSPRESVLCEMHDALSAQFKGPLPFDALFCSADELAAGAIAWLREGGRPVPEEISVVGFNDGSMSALFTPPLASIARHDDKVADAAIELLFKRLADDQSPPARHVVSMKLQARTSIGGLPFPESVR